MYLIRLFHRDNPFQQIEALALQNGNLTVGRDAGAGLVISDPSHEISRLHCEFALRGRDLTLRDLSSNGVFIGRARRRLSPREPVPVREREPIHVGQYILLVETVSPDSTAVPQAMMAPSLFRPAIFGLDSVAIPPDWTTIGNASDARDSTAATRDSAVPTLFDAFCEGAKLDPAQFEGVDRAEIMRRAGAVYQQTVLGLGVLMAAREVVELDATHGGTASETRDVSGLAWGPTASVGVELLRGEIGADAVKGAYIELRKHFLCLMAGSRAVLAAALRSLSPEEVEKASEGTSTFGKRSSGVSLRRYAQLYDSVRQRALGEPESPINVAFREAYDQQRRELAEMSTLS
jgi:predicted component of type VI protein secretion system